MMRFDRVSVELGDKQILDQISFSLQPHKITALLGRNGCGKSTLLSCLTGTKKYTGEILLDDRNLALMTPRERAARVAVLPQVLPKVPLTVRELVSLGRNPYLDLGRHLTEADREQIDRALSWTGLEQLADKRVEVLSGGERQKAYLAMVLAQNTGIIVLDEPTTYLDMGAAADVAQLLVTLKTRHKKTILIVMHDLTGAVEFSDNLVVIRDGRIAFAGCASACVESGIIESVFEVRKGTCCKDGRECVLFYR